MFVNRGVWDRNLFDRDPDTHFVARLAGRALRVDFGEPVRMDRLVIRTRDREAPDLNPALHQFAPDAVASQAMMGKPLEVVVLVLKGGVDEFEPEAWLTAYPIPFESRELVLHDAP